MKIYNLMSGANFTGGAYSSDWIMAWLGLFIIAVLIMLSKKWFEEDGLIGEYSFLGGFFGPIVYFIVISLTGETKYAILAGLIGMIAGGKIMARFSNG